MTMHRQQKHLRLETNVGCSQSAEVHECGKTSLLFKVAREISSLVENAYTKNIDFNATNETFRNHALDSMASGDTWNPLISMDIHAILDDAK